MKKVVFDLVVGMEGPEVANLQDGLALMLERNWFDLPGDEITQWLGRLEPERRRRVFGEATAELVGMFQERAELDRTGEVTRETANALNEVLARLGAFDAAPARTRTFVVAGKVTDQFGEPYAGLAVVAYHDDGAPIRLGMDRSDASGCYTIRFEDLTGVPEIMLKVEVANDVGPITGVGPSPLRQMVEHVDLSVDRPVAPEGECRVGGRIVLDNGAPAVSLTVRLYRQEFGHRSQGLATGVTGADGDYVLTFGATGRAVVLEVRAVPRAGDEVPLSRPIAMAATERALRVDLVAPASLKSDAPEYQRLTAALMPELGGRPLADARENAQQRDLTALHAATGWDARTIALAATAQRLEQDDDVPLRAEELYGLLRAGLPSDKHLLAQVDPEDVGVALTSMSDQGIVALTASEIEDVKDRFVRFAKDVRLAMPAPGVQTTYAELLKSAGVNEAAVDAFATVFLKHRGDPARLWQEARSARIADTDISRLQWQGKLAFLAGNSGKVTECLMQKLQGGPVAPDQPAELKSPAELVTQDLYDAQKWKDLVRGLAADEAGLSALVPGVYQGATVEERLDAYAADMARKIRISYPTEVVTRMVETDKIKLNGGRDATVRLLRAATEQGFTIGRTPVERFLSTGMVLPEGMAQADIDLAKQEIKTLHRLYQITANNESMSVLKELGLEAALDVTALKEHEFYRLFDERYVDLYGKQPTESEKRLIWCRAQQVSSMTYNIFAVAKKLDSDLALPAVSGQLPRQDVEREGLVEALKGYPTMEKLFGSMDFCECEHCRSVLSPAAYLVDLLQFVEAEPQARANFLKAWAERNGQTYHQMGFVDPYDALVSRRPDLPHTLLTCENTNVALPYIDFVNEILEYYVAHDGLTKDAAHDTGDATSAELLAEPQNVITEAYGQLRGEQYPLTLPFDLWLETVREFCTYAETPLHQVLETFRTSEELLPDAAAYGWAGIFIETLGLSPDERAIFANPDPLATWWRLYGYDSEREAITPATRDGQRLDLNSAKTLARRLGVTYRELVQLVGTRFVNPNVAKLGVLHKLSATVSDLRAYLKPENHAFLADNKDLLGESLTPEQQERVKALTEEQWELLTDLGGFADRVQQYADRYDMPMATVMAGLEALAVDDVYVLADPDAGCGFDKTILRPAGGGDASTEVFLRLNLFVRLWRTLGWSLDEVDQALTTFIPDDEPFTDAHFATKPLETALVYLAHLKELSEKLSGTSRARLLTLWTDIPTEGKNSLYAQLFLTRSVLKTDTIFDHPNGDYLAHDWVAAQGQGRPPEFVLIKGHLPAIQSALGLTADEVTEILRDAGEPIEAAELTITNLSVLHRYGMLAKALRLSVHELITLKALSGRQPFKPLQGTHLTRLDEDHPYVETLAFVTVVEKVRRSGLGVADIDFLLRRRFDEAGPRRPDRPAMLARLATMADAIRAIRAEHAVPTDPKAITEEFLRQKLGLLLAPVDTETVLRMLRGQEDVTTSSTRAFFANVLRKQQVGQGRETGFLDPDSFPDRFQPLPAPQPIELSDTPEQAEAKHAENEILLEKNRAELQSRRAWLAAEVLPVLQDRLIRQLVVQTLAAETGAEPAVVERLVTDAELLSIDEELMGLDAQPRSVTQLALVDAFIAAAEDGIDADFYDSVHGTEHRQDTPRRLSSADTALRPATNAAGQPLPPAKSARFNGFLVVRTTGPYRFTVNLEKAGATARLSFEHLTKQPFLDAKAARANAEFGLGKNEFLDLQAARPYRFSFELDALGEGAGRLNVQGETTPRGPLSQLALYPASGMAAAEAAYTLLLAVLELMVKLGLTLREIEYIVRNPANWADVNLSELPTTPAGDDRDEAAATKRFGWFLRLAEYADLKRELAGGTEALIDVFAANATGGSERLTLVYERLGQLARRDPDVVRATAETLFADSERDFADDRILLRLWDALKLVERLGAPAAAIKGWTRIAMATSGNGAPADDVRCAIAREIKETIKARFDPETWQRVAQPIFDRLRKRQRDALVATTMNRLKLSSQEQLFERFLIDPGMEPVVQTSRIRLAIGSVQLFIQRCLLGLEKQVHPSAILNVEQWDWMKHYRVWEANRKIFLFPENWLEPEFRDDKTHLFTELESALMQNDVSADVAEDAFLTYLNKLAALAKLEIVAMHIESRPDFANNTLHVFGRTHSTPHKYFYRRYTNSMWSPWEPVGVDIEGDHLAPVVWRDRLYLFWVTFMEKARSAGNGPANANDLRALPVAKRDVEAYLHWSQYVAGEWQTPESSGYQTPVELRMRAENLDAFDPQTVFVHVRVVEAPDIGAETATNLQDAGLYISLGHPFNKAFYLASRHSTPIPRGAQPVPPVPFGVDKTRRRPTSYLGAGGLTVSFRQRIITGPGQAGADVRPESQTILATAGSFTVLPANNRLTMGVSTEALDVAGGEQEQKEVLRALEASIGEMESLLRPVFFQDAYQVFFVEPEVTERTIQQWEEWVTRTPQVGPEKPDWHIDPGVVKPQYPKPLPIDPIGPRAKFSFKDSLRHPKAGADWLVNPSTGLLFDGQVIGGRGLAPVEMIPVTDVAEVTAMGAAAVSVNAGSGVAADTAAVVTGGALETEKGLATRLDVGLTIIGSAGVAAGLRQQHNLSLVDDHVDVIGPMQ